MPFNESPSEPLVALPADVPAPRRGLPWVAWCVILGIVGFIVWHGMSSAVREHSEARGKPAELVVMDLQARYLLGVQQLLPADSGQVFDLAKQIETLDTRSPAQRLRAAVLFGEVRGPQAALDHLQALRQEVVKSGGQLLAEDGHDLTLLQRLYQDYAKGKWAAPSLHPADTEQLQHDLGWFGRLALAPAQGPDAEARQEVMQSARSTALVMGGGFLVGSLLMLAGGVGLLLFLSFALAGRIRGGIACGSPNGGLYAETFAVWLVLFLGFSYLAAYLNVGGNNWAIGRAGVGMLLSLSALAWPVLRGVSWRQVRQEVGWTAGRRPLLEPFCGVGCYIMSWPLVAVGLLVTVALVMVQKELAAGGGGSSWVPVHPAAGLAVEGDWWMRLQLLLVAAVVAPIVEETMFRGVLYRHLREGSQRLGRIFGVLFSATVAGFIFAVIHPQGVLAVPVLMAIAYGLVMAREWRGTLVPGMFFHGLHNGMLLLLLILVAG